MALFRRGDMKLVALLTGLTGFREDYLTPQVIFGKSAFG
jgi:hypothetical protein